jgi:mRNA interferase MazF
VKRGDVVTVTASGDYAKPQPVVIVQTDALPAEHASVIVFQMTSDIVHTLDFRVIVSLPKQAGCNHALKSWLTNQ